jgi:hypothetical protein
VPGPEHDWLLRIEWRARLRRLEHRRSGRTGDLDRRGAHRAIGSGTHPMGSGSGRAINAKRGAVGTGFLLRGDQTVFAVGSDRVDDMRFVVIDHAVGLEVADHGRVDIRADGPGRLRCRVGRGRRRRVDMGFRQ